MNENMNNLNEIRTKDKFKFAQIDETIHDTKFETKPVSYLQDCMRRFVKNKASVVAAIIICLISLFAIFEPICDPKSRVASEFTSGEFNDPVFAGVLPKLFNDTGFWDGTKESVITKENYYLAAQTDSNYSKVKLIKEEIPSYALGYPDEEKDSYILCTVRENTYAVGCYNVELTKANYDKLVEENNRRISNNEKSIMKPLIDYRSYTNSYKSVLMNTYHLNENAASGIIDKMNLRYGNNSDYFFQIVPEIIKNNDGSYNISDSRFVLYKDENGNIADIYKRNSDGEVIYFEESNGMYNVRVDYYDYFTYKYGVEPTYLFGANMQGKDILLRLANGCRFSLLLGLSITLINFIIGLIWGAISGYYGGTVDLIMERITDIISNIPTIIIMSIASIQFVNNQDLKNAVGPAGIIVLAIFVAFIYNGWVGVAGTTRMQFYRFKGQEYVLAARTLGAKDRRLIFKHILPNATGTLVTRSVLMIPGVIFSEASLSYLGIIDFENSGINSIGSMINEGKIAGLATYPHILLFPSIVISLLMISFNLFGNGLRDAFNTTLRGSEN